MVRLYQYKPSGNCYKVRLMFRQVGVSYESIELDLNKRTPYQENLIRKLPFGRVPAVELHQGVMLAESNAILLHFTEGTHLMPTDKLIRARVYEWMFWEQYDHEPYIALLRSWRKFTGIPEGREQEVGWRHQRGVSALDRLNSRLAANTFLAGEQYTIADIALFAYTHVAEEGGFELKGFPAILRWLDAVKAQPHYFPITE